MHFDIALIIKRVGIFNLPLLLPSTASLAFCSLGLPPPSAGRLIVRPVSRVTSNARIAGRSIHSALARCQ